MRFLKTYFYFFFVFYLTNTFSQSLNDYRSTVTGNWADASTWERYNGTTWVAATFYPGQVGASANDVTIVGSHTVTLNADLLAGEAIGSVTIGDRLGSGLASIETLVIPDTAGLNTTSFTIAFDGFVTWAASVNKSLKFPTNTNIIVEPVHPDEGIGGVALHDTHGLHANTTPCSNSRAIEIGSVKYSSCQGAGSLLDFEDVNNNGGNLNVTPTSPSPICLGSSIILTSNPGGTGHTPGSDIFTWTAVSVPAGHVFTPVTGIAFENTTDTPTTAGIYTYNVEINNGTTTSSGNVSIIVNICNKTIITNRRITYRVKK